MPETVWDSNQGTLTVYISKAKDLPNLSKLDKQNVMLRLRVAHMTRESQVLFRAGQNPHFDYLEKFDMTPDVRPSMQVEVYSERRKKPPIQIGRCEVDLLNGIRADPKEGYCKWYELKNVENDFAGIIFIELTFEPSVHMMEHSLNDSKRMDPLEASLLTRAVPPLPTTNLPPLPEDTLGTTRGVPSREKFSRSLPVGQHHGTNITDRFAVSGTGSYVHGSAMRQVTPNLGQLKRMQDTPPERLPFLPERSSKSVFAPNFTSSVNTTSTSASAETKITAVSSTTEDTRFHFANLKKLKERINIFNNPNASRNNVDTDSDNTVDIEALQKAIGVVAPSSDEENSDTEPVRPSNGSREVVTHQRDDDRRISGQRRRRRRRSNLLDDRTERVPSKLVTQPALPQLPSESQRKRSSVPNGSIYSGIHSPKLPPLPPIPASSMSSHPQGRTRSNSPIRRKPPPMFE